MSNFTKAYDGLNNEQREAVDTIDGPLLVIAGPGTGKTQLLSARVAHILRKTDTLPQNILCLTFTENGARNMRERLSQFIGREAYDVFIGTYHAFGGDIISRYSEYFASDKTLQPIDKLKKHQIIAGIVDSLSYHDRLKQTRFHINDLISTISEMKRALLTPELMRRIADENARFIAEFNPNLAKIFAGFTRMPRKLDQAIIYFEKTQVTLSQLEPVEPVSDKYGSLAHAANLALEFALIEARDSNSTKPLTKWKDAWLDKNSNNQFVSNARLQNERLNSLANVFERYEADLAEAGYYDFDDMILRAIDAIKSNDDLRFTLQEKYQYVMLDEYQDTNNAQAELINLLTDNPVNEGRPNIMAVGDDDQAIFAFQGANYSNMLNFFQSYRDTKLVNLSKNYRSHAAVLASAKAVAEQIDERLFHQFPGTNKTLIAANQKITSSKIERHDFLSQAAENDWVASKIAELTDSGVNPKEIAVLSPKHKILVDFVPHLQAKNVPMRYEKRENVLNAPGVLEVISMCRLSLAISENERLADSLWPAVLSYSFHKIPVTDIWKISWQVADNNSKKDNPPTNWTRQILTSDNTEISKIGRFFAIVSIAAKTEPFERIFDYLLGNQATKTGHEDEEIISPFRDFYLNNKSSVQMVDVVSDLTVLRDQLRNYQQNQTEIMTVKDMIKLVDAYAKADENMLNTSPYIEADEAVELMTVFKAKGLEYKYVFLLSVTDKLWGASSGGGSNKLTLPANLAPTRHTGTSEDEKLRLLFVAMTRAKIGLFMTSYLADHSGKSTVRLKYLDERQTDSGGHEAHVLPENYRTIQEHNEERPELSILERSWKDSHTLVGEVGLNELLAERLAKYQLSPTHLNNFCDLIYGGPQAFLVNTLLRFPSEPGIDGEFGNAVHETLEWYQHKISLDKLKPEDDKVIDYFSLKMRERKIPADEIELLVERGNRALTKYLEQRKNIYTPNDRAETNFKHEGVFVGDAHMAGKIDRLEIDEASKTITVVDYKTGSPSARWVKSDAKLHKYRQQLYCYKLLVEASHSFKKYTVESGRLEFIEPDEDGNCHSLTLDFNDEEIKRTKQLIESMWQHVIRFDFPDITNYDKNYRGIVAFEQKMIDTL